MRMARTYDERQDGFLETGEFDECHFVALFANPFEVFNRPVFSK